MVHATFYIEGKDLRGFEISGHSGYAEAGSDIICASVSSAAYMAANTVTEIVGAKAEIEIDDGYFRFVTYNKSEAVQTVLKGLRLHVSSLADDYSQYIVCNENCLNNNTEV